MRQINSRLKESGDVRFEELVFEMGCNGLFEPNDFTQSVITEVYE